MGRTRGAWLVVALVLTACAGSDIDSTEVASRAAQGNSGAAVLPGSPEPESPEGTVAGHGPSGSVSHHHDQPAAAADPPESAPDWRDTPPGATDEGGNHSEEYHLPPESLKSAWTEVSPGQYRVLRPATQEELGGFRVILPPPEAVDWMTGCVNHHADSSDSSAWSQEVRVSQAVLGCTTSAGLMEHAIQRYGADRECVQRAYSDDYNAVGGQGNSWTQCPTIGNPSPLDGRSFAEKCRDAVLRGLELKGHSRSEKIAADTCPLFEADLAAHLAVPGTTRLCAEHWVLNAVLNAEAPGSVPGLQKHVGVNTNGTC
ncbi:hypothetical protein [Candidatus Poriferisocius sp.]|uniref:hypothetical protein n=1 Tax=Candidatus Poriferisocius sp. TaxID=3101276 RepID=UPI003B027BCB